MSVAILIPAYNEEETVEGIVQEARRYGEVTVCDDGSTDSTLRILRQAHSGKGAAMRRLFLDAAAREADAVVTMDADGQHDPREIPKLVSALEHADVVIGQRTLKGTRLLGNRLLSGKEDAQSGFRAYRGSVLPVLVPSESGMGVDSEILERARQLGLRVVSVPVSSPSSPDPHKVNIAFHFLDVAFTRWKLATFRHPLLMYGLPGLLTFGVGGLFAVSDFATLLAQGFGSVILMLVGVGAAQLGLMLWSLTTLQRRSER